MKKALFQSLLALTLAAALLLCAGVSALAVVPDPNPPVGDNASSAATPQPAATEAPSSEPSGEPTEEAEPVPLVPGTYEGSDGSTLKVKRDGSCTYETVVSGTVNGKAMSGRLTFHGTVDNGEFSFTKVTFFGLDLTAIAASAGYTDASYWETAAGIIYADGLEG